MGSPGFRAHLAGLRRLRRRLDDDRPRRPPLYPDPRRGCPRIRTAHCGLEVRPVHDAPSRRGQPPCLAGAAVHRGPARAGRTRLWVSESSTVTEGRYCRRAPVPWRLAAARAGAVGLAVKSYAACSAQRRVHGPAPDEFRRCERRQHPPWPPGHWSPRRRQRGRRGRVAIDIHRQAAYISIRPEDSPVAAAGCAWGGQCRVIADEVSELAAVASGGLFRATRSLAPTHLTDVLWAPEAHPCER